MQFVHFFENKNNPSFFRKSLSPTPRADERFIFKQGQDDPSAIDFEGRVEDLHPCQMFGFFCSLASEQMLQRSFEALMMHPERNIGGSAIEVAYRNPRLSSGWLKATLNGGDWYTMYPLLITRPEHQWLTGDAYRAAVDHISSYGSGFSANRETFIPGCERAFWMFTETDLECMANLIPPPMPIHPSGYRVNNRSQRGIPVFD